MSETNAERSSRAQSSGPVTIGGLARASEVGVETVRYYQRRRLLPVPSSAGGVRRYPTSLINRIRGNTVSGRCAAGYDIFRRSAVVTRRRTRHPS